MEMSAAGQIAKSLQEVSAQPKKKKRLGYMDIARGITMLCIIMGHFGIVTVNRFVYSFHVPFFFLLKRIFLFAKGYLEGVCPHEGQAAADSLCDRCCGNHGCNINLLSASWV